MGKLNYNIITEIKKSNKGNVYLAKVEDYDFPVVVKELKNGNISVFCALQEVKSEYLPEIFRVEETEDGLLIIEEYIEGELLADYISKQKLTENGCLNLAEQMCEALKILHSHQPPIIHRDIKPSNMIISSKGMLKLIDFDSSRLYKAEMDTDTRLLGTEKYAPPEQYGFSQTDCRSDIYSLGVVFEKFTMFMSKNRQKHWKRIVEKCTLFAPDSRYQSVSEIEQELKKIQQIGTLNPGKIVIAIGVVLLCLITGALWMKFSEFNSQLDSKSDSLQAMNSDESTSDGAPKDKNVAEDEQSEKEDETSGVDQLTEAIKQEEEVVLDEKYRTIPPEFRDLESDIPAYVSLKERIRENGMVVIYCFKNRMIERDFYVEVKELDYETTKFHGMRIYSEETGQGYLIEEEFVEVQNNVIIIASEYMDSLESGYYTLATIMSYGEEATFERGIYLYVASSDILEEPGMWLQNTTYDYHCGTNDNIHVVVKNDSSKEIASLQLTNGSEVDPSMYQVLHDGRVMEISSELLSSFRSGGLLNYDVVCKDGSSLTICINGVSNSN